MKKKIFIDSNLSLGTLSQKHVQSTKSALEFRRVKQGFVGDVFKNFWVFGSERIRLRALAEGTIAKG